MPVRQISITENCLQKPLTCMHTCVSLSLQIIMTPVVFLDRVFKGLYLLTVDAELLFPMLSFVGIAQYASDSDFEKENSILLDITSKDIFLLSISF